jgi:hypothetical protein
MQGNADRAFVELAQDLRSFVQIATVMVREEIDRRRRYDEALKEFVSLKKEGE